MNWNRICPIEDIVPNTGVGALVDGAQYAIFRLDDDQVFALDNYCPFSRANVLARGIVGDLNAQLVVASPIYKQHFRLSDGVCLEDESQSVAAYPVRIADGFIEMATRDGIRSAA